MPKDIKPNTDSNGPKKHGRLNFMLDFGPLLVFFIAFKYFSSDDDPLQGPLYSTAIFMVAITISMIAAKVKLGKISPMMWMSSILVIGFGGLTLYFENFTFIQMKPTIVYSIFAILLIGGYLRGKALLRYLLESALEGVSDEGWLKLSRNWGLFFIAMAISNEIIWRNFSIDTWTTIKVFGFTAISFVFTMANIPFLLKHGLSLEEKTKEEDT